MRWPPFNLPDVLEIVRVRFRVGVYGSALRQDNRGPRSWCRPLSATQNDGEVLEHSLSSSAEVLVPDTDTHGAKLILHED